MLTALTLSDLLMFRKPLLAILAAIGVSALLTFVLHARVAIPDEKTPLKPLPVLAIKYIKLNSYERESSYLGLVHAGRKTVLGFELPGLLAKLTVKEGSPVAAGDILAQLDDAKLQSLRNATSSDLKRVKIELERANIKANRQKDLSNTGAVSQEAFDDTRLIAQALVAQVDAVQARLNSIDIDIDKSTLRAPYNGVIAEKYLSKGAVVSPGAPVVRLIETGSREAHIGVTVENIHLLEAQQQYTLSLRGQPVEATMLTIRPDVNPVTRTATAVLALPASVSALDGEPISMELEQRVYMEGGWLPVSALLAGQRGIWTVLRIKNVNDKQITVREAVEVLEVQGDMAYVRGTINSGDLVVAHGLHRLVPGASVRIVEN